jgi:hypothetical protein
MRSIAFFSFPLFTLAVVVGSTLAHKAEATTICITCAVKGSNDLFPTTIVDGMLSEEYSAALEYSSMRGVVASLTETDPTTAAMWLRSMPADNERGFTAFVWSPQGSDSESISEFIRTMPDETESRRGRNTTDLDSEVTTLNLIASDRRLRKESVLGGFPSSAIPEPRVAILTAVGIFGLLRHRRLTVNILPASANSCKRPSAERHGPD